MPEAGLITLQLTGKLRRFVQSNLQRAETERLLTKRQGECNRCGACCKILFRCPFLGEDGNGEYTCRIYQYRFTQCRMFPIHPRDLREVSECSYTFTTDGPAETGTSVATAE